MSMQLQNYFPAVLRTLFADGRLRLKSQCEALAEPLMQVISQACDELHRYQPKSGDPIVLRQFLRAVGFTMLDDEVDRIRRFYAHYRDYLRWRGTRKGIEIAARMVTGLPVRVTVTDSRAQMFQIGDRLVRDRYRLLNRSSSVIHVYVAFGKVLDEQAKTMFRELCLNDLSPVCHLHIQERRTTTVKLNPMRLGERMHRTTRVLSRPVAYDITLGEE